MPSYRSDPVCGRPRERRGGGARPRAARMLTAGLAAAALAPAAPAEIVYKHIDRHGNVSYLGDPEATQPGEVLIPMELDVDVTPAQWARAWERVRETWQLAERLEARREAEESLREARVAAAETQLKRAREALDEARERDLSDWQRLVGGRRVLKQGYWDRIEAAEERVAEAKQALQEARR